MALLSQVEHLVSSYLLNVTSLNSTLEHFGSTTDEIQSLIVSELLYKKYVTG